MAEALPHYTKTPPISMATTAAVTGGQLVEVTGNMTCGPAGAASQKVCGVAGRDAGGTNQQVDTVVYRDGVWDLTATGAINAGDEVVAAANGTVASVAAVTTPTPGDVNNTRAIVGVALEAISNTAKGRVALRIA